MFIVWGEIFAATFSCFRISIMIATLWCRIVYFLFSIFCDLFTVNFSSSSFIRLFVPCSCPLKDFRGINSSILMNSWPLVLVFDKLKLISSKCFTFERHDLTTSSTDDLLNALFSLNKETTLLGFGVVLSEWLLVSILKYHRNYQFITYTLTKWLRLELRSHS